ncbi:hypothetical protein M8C21_002528 [Ambrosia artemisiifolia]|uniref:Uncharacterized protein n=1 Tax=Ambrosia artemisiifolia TaxID=4212 RepID=A0AAD5CSI2_AMBAR|nr:hypothetical protein M8C21_002528 [Ambrosia artemisiifolia]
MVRIFFVTTHNMDFRKQILRKTLESETMTNRVGRLPTSAYKRNVERKLMANLPLREHKMVARPSLCRV